MPFQKAQPATNSFHIEGADGAIAELERAATVTAKKPLE